MSETEHLIPPTEIRAVISPKMDVENKGAEIDAGELSVGQHVKDTRGDSYFVKSLLGQGGMGTVYKIEDERTGLDRALKIISPDSLRDVSESKRDVILKRFQREIQVQAKLHNPFVLPVVDVIAFHVGNETVIGFVTDVVEGGTIDDKIDAYPRGMPIKTVLEFAGEIAIALDSLREAGIVHRDLKPGNVYLDYLPNGKQIARVGDFGLVTASGKEEQTESSEKKNVSFILSDVRITDPHMAVGSTNSMSPEQVRGETVSHASDVYALGVLMYEMMTAQNVFPNMNPKQMMRQHVSEPVPAFVSRGRYGVPSWLEDIVMKLLEKKPEDRFRTSLDVFLALKAGVAKEYPDLLREEPFLWNFGSKNAASVEHADQQ